MPGKGTLGPELGTQLASCSCGESEYVCPPLVGGRYDFPGEARRMGWRLTQARGWLCPACAGKSPVR